MSFPSMAHMYKVVYDMYDSPKWRERVRHMHDNQIMAIYFDYIEREASARKAKLEEIRPRNADEAIELSKVKEILASCGEAGESCDGFNGSTDDYIPEQLSFFD